MLVAALASGLTVLATLVSMAETAPVVVPENTEPPLVVGTAQDGQIVTAKDGEWTGDDPTAFTYQWQSCDAAGASCGNIAGATAKIYRVATADVGKRLRVQVTAKNASGSTTVATAPTPAVAHPAGATRLTDGRGYVVRDAIMLVTGVPLGWISAPQELKTNVDGLATLQLQPTTRLRLVRGGSMVMFIRARKEGDNLLAGISSRRLVRVRTAQPSS